MARFIGVLLWIVLCCGVAGGTTVDVVYGYRLVHYGWVQPPEGFGEGGVVATFTADAPIDTAGAQDGLEQVNAYRWTYQFAWDAADSQSFYFRDSDGTAIEVRALPSWPAYDPTAHDLPMVLLDGSATSLWDPLTGIYVWGDGEDPNWGQKGGEWERDFNFRWYEADGTLCHDRTVGVRINGNWSRCLSQKSLRIYFDNHGEPNTISDDFFGPDAEEHEHLILRAGSTRAEMFIKDVMACELMTAMGHPCSRWLPVEVYLNSEYWGMYHLRERLDDDWAQRILGLDGDYALIKDPSSYDDPDVYLWVDFLDDVIDAATPEDHAFYELVAANLDIVSYLDWQLLQIWSATADNGGSNNVVMYRPDGGVWYVMIWDQDAMFHPLNVTTDYFQFFTAATETDFDARRPPVYYQTWLNVRRYFPFFKQFMRNASCRRLLRERWAVLSGGFFAVDHVTDVLDTVVAASQPGEANHHARWWLNNQLESWQDILIDMISDRNPILQTHYTAFMDASMDPVEMDEFVAAGMGDGVHLTWHTEREIDLEGWIVERRESPTDLWQEVGSYIGSPELEGRGGALQPASYGFVDFGLEIYSDWEYRLTYVDQQGSPVVVPWLEPVVWPTSPPAIVLVNEYLASNDTVIADEMGEFDDWVEIYNPGLESVDLLGYYLSDDPDNPLKWPFPAETSIEPLGFLLVWCDDDEEDGPLHTSFKLSASGESIGVYADVDGIPITVDERAFGAQVTDISEGRAPDGGPRWQTFTTPTPGGPNPLVAVGDLVPKMATLKAWPNPFNATCTIVLTIPHETTTHLGIYDAAGRCVRRMMDEHLMPGPHRFTWHGDDDRGAALPSGAYYALLQMDGTRYGCKLMLVK